jgi:hypothetical protein
MTTVAEVIRAAIPDASESVIDHVLWARTPYPAGAVRAKDLYQAASGFIRAHRKGRALCDFCERPALLYGVCAECHTKLTMD